MYGGLALLERSERARARQGGDRVDLAALHRQIREHGRQLEQLRRDQESPERAAVELSQAVDEQRRRNPSRSPEQAYAAALEERPELYERLQGIAPAPELTASLEDAAALELSANPALTPEQAVAAALERNPALYEG